ncbi:hypothetical protein HKX68_19960 [Dickeya dadantii]|uniref:hypothetical protein n=1 Tax=Dickeya dadantii TaxID=204038 RepID=UPI0013726758|nr:hypothetical protein [Dickeya dadantii]NAT79060.1 hypothetical protein [Dickeya dadantii]NPE65013.1 hypothetical protein [Dickeya dadantii]
MSKIVLAQSRNHDRVASALQNEKKRNQGMELVKKDDVAPYSWRIDKTASRRAGIAVQPLIAANENEINISIAVFVTVCHGLPAVSHSPGLVFERQIIFESHSVFENPSFLKNTSLSISLSIGFPKTPLILIMITITINGVTDFR